MLPSTHYQAALTSCYFLEASGGLSFEAIKTALTAGPTKRVRQQGRKSSSFREAEQCQLLLYTEIRRSCFPCGQKSEAASQEKERNSRSEFQQINILDSDFWIPNS